MIGARTGDYRVQRLLDELNLNYEITINGNFNVPFHIDHERSQAVYIESGTQHVDQIEVRQVWSIGLRSEAPLHADIANALLVYNANVNLGAWQLLRDSEGDRSATGDGCLAIFMIPIAAETTAKALRAVMHSVARAADDIEEKLSGNDEY
jgi:hypothetical protein